MNQQKLQEQIINVFSNDILKHQTVQVNTYRALISIYGKELIDSLIDNMIAQIDNDNVEKMLDSFKEVEKYRQKQEEQLLQKRKSEETKEFQDYLSTNNLNLYIHDVEVVGASELLTAEEEKELAYQIRQGNKQAESTLIEKNLKLVISMAKRYQNHGISLEDLIQEGNVGLYIAVQKFSPEKGYRFSTYATWWIRQAITRVIADQANTIRLPIHVVDKLNKMRRITASCYGKTGQNPTEEELAQAMNEPIEKIQEYKKIEKRVNLIALDAPIKGTEDEDSFLKDFITDKDVCVEEDICAKNLKQGIKDVLEDLTPRERQILILRYGLEDGKDRTLEEVGKEFHLTRERIRQIESKALRKLRHPVRSKKIKDFVKQ